MSIKVMLVDDQQLMRDGIKMLLDLETDIELIAEAGDGHEAVRLYQECAPDVVLMDIEMPGMNGIDATRQIKTLDAGAKVMVLTTFGQQEYLSNALLAGAQGFLLKAVSAEELSQSIRKISQGKAVLDSQSTEMLMESYRALSENNETNVKPFLTVREEQILKLLAKNTSNRDIADKLALAKGTVKNYVTQILEKLQAPDRYQAVRVAKEQKLID
ncbi:response regulator transcription factor [Aliiglaciecola sp. CAU 1673]|uniref:response regulator n=1 Tax=Aliiglaciecola sp. CAU 1673 TaxID=3032595 RepID=UPI0023DA779A|nr:response regulator transcription factor [Aliiglaciecola sp. CAU 1673]MDF2177947.1 response regulator transcription factor [Aliiglaciecola sp. CAU 1673]